MATFTTFLNSFDPDSKGNEFEKIFVKWFLKNDPYWSTQVDKVWLWDDYPDRWGPDCGIDLVFTHKNGDVWAVQAKCYSPKNRITKGDINTFLSESNCPEIDRRILIATTDKVSPNGKRVIARQEKPVTCFLFSDFDKSAIEYPSNLSELDTAKRKERPNPRPDQAEAINEVEKGFKESDRGQLIMACGTGKTLTALWIKEKVSADIVLVLVPSLNLLSQTLREWTFACNTPFDFICVCSDQSVVKRGNEDEVILLPKDAPFLVTSNIQEIGDFIKGNGHKTIFSTYQSSPLIAESQRNPEVPAFDLVIADEAHRCAGKVETEFATVLDENKIRAKKRLFATATPRIYSVSLKKGASEKGVEIKDMSDEEVFGKIFYELKFGEAIERGLLTDYQVTIVGVNDSMIGRWIEKRKLTQTNSGNVTDAKSLASQIGLIKAIKKYDLRRIISFHYMIKRAKEFSSDFLDTIDIVPTKQRPKGSIWTDFISGKMTSYERSLKLGQLKELSGGDRGILSNAKCLSEGVDVPSLDAVAFIDPKSSPTDIVQAVGRAIRLSKDKKVGTIVLPVFIEDGKNAETSIEASNFKPIWNVLNALKAHDDVFSFELDQLRTELGKSRTLPDGRKGLSKIIFDLPESVDSKFANSLTTYLVEKTTASWNFWFGLLENYVERENSSIVNQNFKTTDGYKLGYWVSDQRIRKESLLIDQIEKLENLPGWSWNRLETKWSLGYSFLVNFFKEEKHLRVPVNFKTEDGYNLWTWICQQRQKKKNCKLDSDKIEKLEQLDGWVWDPIEDRWNKGYAYLMKFIEEEGHALTPQDYETTDGFKLGDWVSSQRYANKNKLSLEKIHKLEKLDGWVWSQKKEQWDIGYAYLLKFIEEEGHSRVPQSFITKDKFKLGNWVSSQRKYKNNLDLPEHQRKKRIGIISDEKIKRLESLKGWVWKIKK